MAIRTMVYNFAVIKSYLSHNLAFMSHHVTKS
jgi:hypothetical protein